MKKIIVTTSWDDGHKLDIKTAKLLKKYGITGTFYISPWNREFSKSDLLTDDQIVAISRHFEIGAHTLTHPILPSDFKTTFYKLAVKLSKLGVKPSFEIVTNISEDEAKREILGSKEYLEKLLGKRVFSFCYPHGRHNNKIQKLVEKSGFKYARTVERYKFDLSKNVFASGTALHTYKHYQDALKIARFSGWNPIEFLKKMDWEQLAKDMFDYVLENGGLYHLWGHSWIIDKHHDWDKVESVLSYIGKRPEVKYVENRELVEVAKT